MPYPSGTYILQIADSNVRGELEQFYALLQGYLSQEHTDSGGHSDVTADSVTVEQVLIDSTGIRVAPVVGQAYRFGPVSDTGAFGLAATDSTVLRNVLLSSVYNGAVGPNAQLILTATATGGTTANFVLQSLASGSGAAQLYARQFLLADTAAGTKPITLDLVNGTITERGRATIMGEWTTWPTGPTWTNLTVGNGTVTARYSIIGKTVSYYLHLAFGGTTSITGDVSVSLPVTAATHLGGTGVRIGTVAYRDASVPARYDGMALSTSTTAMQLFDGANPNANLSNLSPFTWTTSDSICVVGTYEAA